MGTRESGAAGSSGGGQAETSKRSRVPRSDGGPAVSRAEAAAGVEEILLTPRVLNAERYGRLIEELGAVVRAATERAAEIRGASDELRVAQVAASRTLEELRARTESISRSVALIDQRLARGEALMARASEQVQRATEAAARVEALSLPDATEVERRIARAERDATGRLEEAARSGAEAIEALVRDGSARASALAIESARSEAIAVATRTSEGIAREVAGSTVREIVADAESRAMERERAIVDALREQADESARVVRAAGEDAAERATAHATEAAERLRVMIERAEEGVAARAEHLDTLSARLGAIERLAEPQTLDPIRSLVSELGSGIERAETIRDALAGLIERVPSLEAPAASAREGSTSGASTDGVGVGVGHQVEVRAAEARAAEVIRAIDERVRAAAAHAEAVGAWLGQVIGHAQHIGAALEQVLARSARAQGPGSGAQPPVNAPAQQPEHAQPGR